MGVIFLHTLVKVACPQPCLESCTFGSHFLTCILYSCSLLLQALLEALKFLVPISLSLFSDVCDVWEQINFLKKVIFLW